MIWAVCLLSRESDGVKDSSVEPHWLVSGWTPRQLRSSPTNTSPSKNENECVTFYPKVKKKFGFPFNSKPEISRRVSFLLLLSLSLIYLLCLASRLFGGWRSSLSIPTPLHCPLRSNNVSTSGSPKMRLFCLLATIGKVTTIKERHYPTGYI